MVLIDTHAHLYLPHFADDIEQVIRNATQKHVAKILLPNIDSSSVGPMLDLCARFPGQCYPMMGLHPTSVKADYREKLSFLESMTSTEKIVAIGETGMDSYRDTKYLSQQEDSLIMHLEWAKKKDLPLVLHSRFTMDNILSIIKSHSRNNLRGIFHAFSGTVEQAEEAINMGFKLGIGGVVTFKNSSLAPVVKTIDLDNIVLETDSPYLTPVPERGKRNESANLLRIAEKIAEIKNLPVKEVARVTTGNAYSMFNLITQ